ncbi:IdeS/Mac family cysteine endopeptidase [Phocaeicola plebeius]|nr:IdeS/Mac family cysteine endopeptidase [Phocaeicola plebeius]
MNFIIRNLFLIFVLLCAVACSSDENFDQSSLENIDFRVSVAGQSRVVIQKDGSGDFQVGDEVALRVYESQPDKLQDKTLLHCEGNRWTSSLYWKDWEGTPHFYAVWPSATQIELWEGACWYVHRVNQNQSAEKDFLSSDLLVADTEGQRYSPVNLDFRHAMSRVTVNIRNMEEALSDEERKQMQVYVHGYLSGRFALSGNAVQAADEMGWIQAFPMEEGSFVALVVPGEMERFRTEGWVKIVAGSRELVYNAPESIGNSLESGKQVTVNLQLKSEEVVPEEPVWWVEGVQPSDQWEYEAPVYRMPWTQNCGWFDCNKLDARDTSPTGDGRTCWEASSSNLMHWWLNANRSYVERYLEYKRRLNPDFSIPSAYPDSKHSEIYQGFKNRFGNKSGYIVSGVNWFLSGICNQVMYPQDVPEQENAGFFFDVFGRNSLVKQYGNGYMTKEEFNNAIKLARKQGMAVGLDIFIQGGGHAINLWGAEFDEKGEVSTIYLVDNNDGNLGDWMYKAKIVYEQDASSGALFTYMKWVYNEDLKIKIMDLVLLDKGTSYWESFFKNKNG